MSEEFWGMKIARPLNCVFTALGIWNDKQSPPRSGHDKSLTQILILERATKKGLSHALANPLF